MQVFSPPKPGISMSSGVSWLPLSFQSSCLWPIPASEPRLRPAVVLQVSSPASPGEPSSESDEALMQGYRRGNEAAFRELYARYRSPVLRFVRRLCPDSNDAEEIAQETWLAIVRGKERYETRARFTTYLFSIAHRRTMDRWCQRGRAPDVGQADDQIDTLAGSTSSEPDVRASNDELREDLLAAVAALPLAQREAFLLRAEGGLGLEEIAEITGTNRETAKSRLRFALVRLREALESWA